MEKRAVRRNVPGFLIALCAFALAATFCVAVHPAAALAEETGVAHTVDSNGMRHYYATVNEAKEAGYSNGTVYMDADWDLGSGSLDIADSKSITIQTAGHKIVSSNKNATIYVNEHASVTITSYEGAKAFSYRGYAKNDPFAIDEEGRRNNLKKDTWRRSDLYITASGLITNTNEDEGSGIRLEKGAKVSLENVTVAGCSEGGIYMKDGSTADLANTTICHNKANNYNGDFLHGGGVRMGDSCNLNLNASHIDDNYACSCGGGVYAGSGAHIYLENGSTINRNGARGGGGGVYFNKSFFTLKSSDATGTISGNASYQATADSDKKLRDGGGIHIDTSSGNNEGLIEGFTISGNYAGYDGGGVILNQRWTTVRNCDITDNMANVGGGGARVNGDNVAFEDCTVTGNVCDCGLDYMGNHDAGGGIKVDYDHDVILRGTCVVKNNKRNSDGRADDVYLESWIGRAYIKGSLSQGSSVGVRTDYDGDLRVAKKFSCSTKDGLFADMNEYYISYGTDEGGDAWQRNTIKKFTVALDGQNPTKYMQGLKVALVAPRTVGDDLVFWHWDLDKTTGLYPISDYFTTKDPSNLLIFDGDPQNPFINTFGFKMPQNDVNVCSVYAVRAKKMGVSVKAPVAGEALPTGAEAYRLDGAGLRGPFSASVIWYEVASDGSQTKASGVAKAGTVYAAEISLSGNDKYGLFFSSSISAQDVTLVAGSGSGSVPAAESASVDSGTGRLTIKTGAFEKTAGEAAETKTGTVTVQVEKKALLGDGEEAQAAALSDEAATVADASANGSDDVANDEFEVSYTYSSDSDEVTITAPSIKGYNFCYWDGTGSDYIDDDPSVVVPAWRLVNIKELIAVYTPVATKIDVDMVAPAAGEKLAETAVDIEVTCYDGAFESFADALGQEKGTFKVSWLPESEDATAAYSATYTALIEVCDADGITDVENVLAQDAVVTCGGVRATSAGFVVVGGKLCLAAVFPATDAVKATSVSQPADVELTFEQATGYAAEQAAHPDTLCWPLPKAVAVTLNNGEVVDGDVTWEIPAGFDAAATGAQELTAKGTVSIASEGEIDTSGISLDVSTTIKVAAPEQGGSGTPVVNPDNGGSQPSNDNSTGSGNTTDNGTKAGNDGSKSNDNATTSNGNAASTKASTASTSAKTGDSLPIAGAAATAAVAAIAAAVAIAATVRRREG